MLPLSRFLSFIEQNQLFNSSEKVLLAVSGGKDSVLMTHLFNEANFSFGIAHCNFGLRDQESNQDEKFTKALAKQLNVPFFTTRFNTEQFAAEKKLSIQMAARELRYCWFEEIRVQHNYNYIAVAHHQSDATETILLNLVRGTGIAGMHGIRPKRDKIVRPLLFLRTQEIDKIITENNISYREDSSNRSSKYARNKIRLEVIPKLKELNAFLDETFELNSKRFSELEEFLNKSSDELRKKLFQIQQSGGSIHIALDDLKKIQPADLLLYELFKPYNFSEAVLSDLKLSWANQPGRIFESPTHRLLLDRNILILTERIKKETVEALIYKDNSHFKWGAIDFTFTIAEQCKTEILTNSDKAYFDEALLHFPLKLRHWKKGDYFYPFGMKGKKKLSDFFTGLKIPLTEKSDIPILENGNGDIIWVAGYRSDERYKIKAHTKKVVIFEKYKINEH